MGCTYKTAWFFLHRLRQSMINDARTPLHGRIEADETIIGGPVKGIRGRGVTSCTTKTLVFSAVEVVTVINKQGASCEKAGRLRLNIDERTDEESIRIFLLHMWKKVRLCKDG